MAYENNCQKQLSDKKSVTCFRCRRYAERLYPPVQKPVCGNLILIPERMLKATMVIGFWEAIRT